MLEHYAVRVPATTANLGAGYDTFGTAIERWLVARTVDRRGADRVSTVGEGSEELDRSENNLVWRSFVALCDHARVPVPDVAIDVATSIPLERGLGSSSAAIVAGLGLARAVTAAGLGDEDLAAMAAAIEGHPDNVVPAVLGGLTASVLGDDGQLVIRRAQPHPRLRPVVLVPAARQSTASARGLVPRSLACADVSLQVGRAGHVLGALAGLWPASVQAAGDRLHEPARLAAMGPSGQIVDRLREAGLHAWLSGAGPSVVVAAPRRDDAVSRCRDLAAAGAWRVVGTDWDLAGLVTCPVDGPGCARAGQRRCSQCPAERVS